MTARTEIHADGTFNDQIGVGGWAAVTARRTSGRQDNASIYEMGLRAMVEAVKMAEGPCTVISDYEWLVQNAQRGTPQATCRTLWDELFAAAAGKDIEHAWNRPVARIATGSPTRTGRGAGTVRACRLCLPFTLYRSVR